MTTTQSLVLLTCSMARDRDLFALLARSVDDCVDPAIPHRVIVPGADMATFRPFANARRQIVAQEDVLPFRVLRVPALPRALASVSQTFRRPFYVDRRLRIIRGWILQQVLKIEATRAAAETTTMHVDSDVFFFRKMGVSDVFRHDAPPFFRATGKTANPRHDDWIAACARMLGIEVETPYPHHYIENCVPWSRDITRALTTRMEEVGKRPWHSVLIGEPAFSEYYLYGLFVDRLLGGKIEGSKVWTENGSFCHSYWPASDADPVDADTLLTGIRPTEFALAVQSTHPLSAKARTAIYETARARETALSGAGA